MISGRGLIYTVDEVSGALGIPRPTLYRYLREYSIPHLRRSGKISIPEESLEGIRAARKLHKEGLGTESVRRKLREGDDPGQLTQRLDQISEGLEKLRVPDLAEQAPPYQEALQAILEKQDLLISAVTDLSKKMEGLQSTGLQPQYPPVAPPRKARERLRKAEATLQENQNAGRTLVAHGSTTEELPGTAYAGTNGSANGVAVDEPVVRVFGGRYDGMTLSEPMDYPSEPAPRDKFGVMARRRKRAVLALLAGLVSVAILAGWLVAGQEEEIEQPGDGEVAVEEADLPSITPVMDESKDEGEDEVSRTVEVPYLVGLTLPDAEARLAEAGLQRGNMTEIASDIVPVGGVTAQSPLVGAPMESGNRVDLVISIGSAGIPPGISNTEVGAYPVDVAPLPVAEAQYPGGVFGSEPFAPVVPPAPVVG
jgi:DNA-binding transcriptional MerR regulator